MSRFNSSFEREQKILSENCEHDKDIDYQRILGVIP